MRAKLFSLLALIVILTQPLATSGVYNEPSVGVEITNAYYANIDGNAVDEVIVHTKFTISGFPINNINYLITLTLPSGRSFSYIVIVITSMDVLTIENMFYDHALESGWYTVEVYVKLGGFYDIADSDSTVFDPPGGDSADPGGLGVRVI